MEALIDDQCGLPGRVGVFRAPQHERSNELDQSIEFLVSGAKRSELFYVERTT